jgi:hypothetical protein
MELQAFVRETAVIHSFEELVVGHFGVSTGMHEATEPTLADSSRVQAQMRAKN